MANEAVTRAYEVNLEVPETDPTEMSGAERRAALVSVGRAEACLAGWKTRLVNAERDQHGVEAVERVLREELQSSRREATRDVKSSAQLAELPVTSAGLEAGEIPAGHARLIARAASEGPIDESVLAEAAQRENYDKFAKTLRHHQQEMSDDDGQSIFDRQRENRTGRAFVSRETGMFVLSGEFDPTTGARIDTVLATKERELWNAEDPKSRRTPQQRMADALAELILEPGKGKAKGTALMVVADYDVVNQELVNARLADGSPIPTAELIRLACDADLLPGVFRAATQEMNLGRKRRTASDAQRAALIYRDKECIGCGTSAHRCFAHHVQFWRNGGPTDFANLVLVCNKCHHSIHDDGWEVTHEPATGRRSVDPPSDPFPDTGVDSYRPSHINPVLLS
ncbi:DUF222 domain-containing protein [Candidatus Poriferisocius sp.]|uniref:HNH endonuclease n=1 Tax=Candidatus Poriferisocius sp. TaxID=3101276 RepID=UPI003B013470